MSGEETVPTLTTAEHLRRNLSRIVVIGTLLGVMLFVRTLDHVDESAATLATIGFVVLAAFAAAELGQRFALPQVTGYIVAGIALGPSLSGIISGGVVRDMRMFNTLALGLIATSAGLELDLRQIGRLKKTLSATILVKGTVGVALVGATFLAVQAFFHPLQLAPGASTQAVALVLGVLSIGTSPAIVLAVLNETRSKGRLSDLVLGAAIFKDLVVVVALAVAIAVCRVLLAPAQDLDAGVLVHVGQELFGSLMAGAAVGGVLILYIRFVHAEMLLFVSAMVLVVAELCRVMHLELLLVFITSGFVVRNFSRYEHDLLRPLELVALPVFVVFFTNAGASIDLRTTVAILPLALAICGARALGYWVAARVGGAVGRENALVRGQAWQAYLPQAGVTLGLVGLAAQQLPELAQPISSTGMAVVAINLLAGPIALRRSLAKAGEIEGGKAAASPALVATTTLPVHTDETPAARATPLPKALEEQVAAVRAAVADVVLAFDRDLAPRLPSLPERDAAVEDDDFAHMVTGHRTACQHLFEQLAAVLGQLPRAMAVRVGDGRSSTQRNIPIRRIARITLEPAFAATVAERFQRGLRSRVTTSPSQPAESSLVDHGIEAAFVRFAALLDATTQGKRSTRTLRYSEVHGLVESTLAGLMGTTEERLIRFTAAAWGSTVVEARVQATVGEAEAIYAELVEGPANAALAALGPAMGNVARALSSTPLGDGFRNGLDQEPGQPPSARLRGWRGAFERVVKRELGELARQYRATTTLRQAGARLRKCIAALETSLERLELGEHQGLQDARVREVPIRHLGEAYAKRILPALDEAVRTISNALARVPGRVQEALEPEWFVLEAHADQVDVLPFETLAKEHLDRAQNRIALAHRATERTIKGALEALSKVLQQAQEQFQDGSRLSSDVSVGAPDGLGQALRRAVQGGARLIERLRRELVERAAPDDAAAIRARVTPAQALSQVLKRWFSEAPVHDERIFAGRTRELEQVLDAEAAWAAGAPVSVLLTGPWGVGKSSLLNMCELEARNANLIRINATEFTLGTRLTTALCGQLECPVGDAPLRRHLAAQRPTVFVDDLGAWLSHCFERHEELRSLLQLIAESRRDALWIVSIDASFLRLLNELEPVEEAFSHVIRLGAMTASEVRGLVEARVRRAGLVLHHEADGWSGFLDTIGLRASGDRFYRILTQRAEGLPGLALHWFSHTVEVAEKGVHASPKTLAQLPSLTIEGLSESHLALLVTLVRYGASSLSGLADELLLTPDRVRRHLAFLLAAGLVELDTSGGRYGIPAAAQWSVFQTLRSSRLL